MAEVTFTQDGVQPVDRRLIEISDHSAQLERPLRIRLQPDLYDYKNTAWTSWSGLVWTLETRDIEEARRLREGLADFFRVFGADEKRQRGLLNELARRAVGVGR